MNKTIRRKCRRVQKCRKSTFKKAAPNHCGKLVVLNRFAALTPSFSFQIHASDWRGQGLEWTYMDAKRLCLQDKKLNFVIVPKKVSYFTFFSHFHENCLFHTWSHSVKSATPYERHCYHSKKNLDASKTKSLWGLRLSWVTQKRNGWLELWIILDYLYIQVIHYNAYQFGNSQNLKESIMNSSFFFFFFSRGIQQTLIEYLG